MTDTSIPVLNAATDGRASEDQREREFDALLDKYREQHGRVVGFLDEDYGPLVFKRPERPAFKRFVSEMSGDDADYTTASENLALACVVHPPRERFAAIVDEMPGIALQASTAIQEISKATGKARTKKR